MGLSFHEKSLWLTLVAMLVAYGYYFGTVLPAESDNVLPQQVVLFIAAIVLLVVVSVLGHILIAVTDRRQAEDERDRLVALKGARNASAVLAVGVFLALSTALITAGNFAFTHVLLAGWVLSHVVNLGSQLFLLRRGA